LVGVRTDKGEKEEIRHCNEEWWEVEMGVYQLKDGTLYEHTKREGETYTSGTNSVD